MNEIMKIHGIECYEKDGIAYLKLEAVARGLGFTTTQNVNGIEYVNVRWKRVEEYLEELSFATCGKRPDFIPENIFYRLAMKAKNETAEKFQALVADEIIPQIRKTGGYIPVNTQDDDLTILAKAHQILERTIAQKEMLISQLTPKAETYDMIMNADGTFSMNQVAKQVGMGEYTLFAYLRGKKVLYYEGTDNIPYERYRKQGYFTVIDTTSPDGKAHSTTRVTQKGLDFICRLLRKDKGAA